jgi:hypothetical protein
MNTQILITIDERGCNVQGHIDNKLIAMGMLELAKDAIRKHHDQKNAIVPATVAESSKILASGAIQ